MTASMINNITDDFDIKVNLDERNHLDAPKTPTKVYPKPTSYAPVSPFTDENGCSNVVSPSSSPMLPTLSSSSSSTHHASPTRKGGVRLFDGKKSNIVVPSEHKLAELDGRFLEEPLLKENPNRFVLFPIEDNEVRALITCVV